ncbi:MAG TPA: hypothetical protein VMM84_01495 [Pyrinomonadaceae bacterium]|nr:hypothetical protein [Pyrinomonadaceae bacterium]
MSLTNNALGASPLNIILAMVGLLLMTVCLAPSVGAQETGVPEPDEPLTLEELYLTPGELLASGVDKQPSGPLQPKSYKVEEVKLPRPLRMGEGTDARVFDTLLRLTVTLGSPAHGPYMILLDDEPQTAIITQRDGISTIYFNAAELEDGAQISVAVGTGCKKRLTSTMTSKLRMPEPYKLPRRGDADLGHGVKKIRTVHARAGSSEHDQVEFQLTTPARLPITSAALVMEVGSLEVGGGGYAYGDKNTLLFRMSVEQFSRAEDGKRIRVKFGYCSGPGLRFGRLNKAQLDQ